MEMDYLGLTVKSFGQTYTPTDIQSHLYLSFLHGHTADVVLHTKGGSWEAVYQLHRVVLIQSGFFRSLFTAGFLESHQYGNNSSSGSPPEQVNICFDDLNITRSAFEVCIARLYGGGPGLYLSPSLISTPSCPLTPSFYFITPSAQYPPGNHPATPRFLLSLLATSIYLSIPSITSQALSMILSSVGPHTVVRYINFATGLGIGSSEGDDPEAAVGLENVGKEVPYTDDSLSPRSSYTKHRDSDGSDITRKLSRLEFEESGEKEDGSSVGGGTYIEEPAFNYGGIGDKIGEACACWLMRWSADILPFEEDTDSEVAMTSKPSPLLHPVQGHSPRRATMLSERSPSLFVPKLWGRGGLSTSWACTVISSNDFFIRNEWNRYEFASRVINLRRRDGLDHTEETEWAQLFQRGIYYSNMSFEELIRISQDISPITGRPYVPIQTIEAAHWQQSILRHRTVTRSPVSGAGTASPPPQSYKELGIALSTAEILATLSSETNSDVERLRPYYPIPMDSSQRVGDSDSAFATAAASADELLGSASDLSGQGYSTPRQSNFFGILSQQYTAPSCIQTDMTGKARWSLYPPFRFAVEFWGVGQLVEKSRIYSHTIWYAGSLFNVYVQVVRKKGIQLGIYLHRQSSVDAIPRASTPRISVSTRGERLLNSTFAPSSPLGDLQAQPRPQTPRRGHVSVGSSSSTSSVAFAVPGSPPSPAPSQLQPSPVSLTSSSIPAPVAPIQPYRDPRSTISAHFTISCSSATGSSLIRFSSSPDQFSIGQSWGWKSSSLRTEEYIEPNGEAKARELNREASLRATVVLGLI